MTPTKKKKKNAPPASSSSSSLRRRRSPRTSVSPRASPRISMSPRASPRMSMSPRTSPRRIGGSRGRPSYLPMPSPSSARSTMSSPPSSALDGRKSCPAPVASPSAAASARSSTPSSGKRRSRRRRPVLPADDDEDEEGGEEKKSTMDESYEDDEGDREDDERAKPDSPPELQLFAAGRTSARSAGRLLSPRPRGAGDACHDNDCDEDGEGQGQGLGSLAVSLFSPSAAASGGDGASSGGGGGGYSLYPLVGGGGQQHSYERSPYHPCENSPHPYPSAPPPAVPVNPFSPNPYAEEDLSLNITDGSSPPSRSPIIAKLPSCPSSHSRKRPAPTTTSMTTMNSGLSRRVLRHAESDPLPSSSSYSTSTSASSSMARGTRLRRRKVASNETTDDAPPLLYGGRPFLKDNAGSGHRPTGCIGGAKTAAGEEDMEEDMDRISPTDVMSYRDDRTDDEEDGPVIHPPSAAASTSSHLSPVAAAAAATASASLAAAAAQSALSSSPGANSSAAASASAWSFPPPPPRPKESHNTSAPPRSFSLAPRRQRQHRAISAASRSSSTQDDVDDYNGVQPPAAPPPPTPVKGSPRSRLTAATSSPHPLRPHSPHPRHRQQAQQPPMMPLCPRCSPNPNLSSGISSSSLPPTPMSAPLGLPPSPSSSRYREDFHEGREIGSGSFGTVVEAWSRVDGCRYAIKIVKREAKGELARKNALREVYALAALCDTSNDAAIFHVVRYHQAWMEGNRLYIQTELCQSTLRREMDRRRTTPSGATTASRGVGNDVILEEEEEEEEEDVSPVDLSRDETKYRLLREMLLALELLHRNDMVHLDIKPDNIFIKNGMFKLGDFGLASKATTRGDVEEGDARYMSRELLVGSCNDLTKCDIFSLGATAYEVCLGRSLPSNGQEWQDLRNGALFPTSGLSTDLRNIVSEMMHPNPERRPTARDLLARRPLLSDEQRKLIAERNRVEEANRALAAQHERLEKMFAKVPPRKKLERSHSCFL